jgi:hypothetical protein
MIGVSKRCCPVCAALLRFLGANSMPGPIRILGSHRTMTPCSLPPFLPESAIEATVTSFERELGRVITKLRLQMQIEDQTRRRSSTSSTNVSADSHPFTQDDQPERISMLMEKPHLAFKYVRHPASESGVQWDQGL